MILVDTSAWVEYLRATGHPFDVAMQGLVSADRILITEPVVMELLAGAGSLRRVEALRTALAHHVIAPVGSLETYEAAAEIYRVCRSGGDPVQGAMDCVIAAVAIREEVPILAADRDFEVIARHTSLRLHPVDPTRRYGR